MAYYRICLGTGFAWCDVYVIKTEYPTTDYGALVDCLIDYLVEKGNRNIFNDEDWETYKWDKNGINIISKTDPTDIIYADEFIQGGNCGDVLRHYGTFSIDEMGEKEIENYDGNVIEM